MDNTADTAKPVSTAQQTALNLKANLSGGTLTGPLNTNKGADIASASTINLDTATGEYVNVTGTTTITAVTLTSGARRIVKFTAALILTHGTNLQLPGAANITTAAGDKAIFVADGAVVHCIYFKADGTPVVSPSSSAVVYLGSVLFTSAVASADITGLFASSAYDIYEVDFLGVKPATDAQDIYLQMEMGGTMQTTSGYENHLMQPTSSSTSYAGTNAPGSSWKIAAGLSNAAASSGLHCRVIVTLPTDAATKKVIHWHGASSDGGGATSVRNASGAGIYNTAGTCTGFRIKAASGNITGIARVYGRKNS